MSSKKVMSDQGDGSKKDQSVVRSGNAVSKPSKLTSQDGNIARKGQTAQPPVIVYNENAMRNNYQVLEYCRTVQAAVSGIASGIIGVSAINGFIFYFIGVLIQAICWEVKAGFGQWDKFFTSRALCINHSLVGGLFTYVLFWVFIYGMVHVY
ncbi:rab5-interacting protein (Rab5ip) domain-containing protein [Ditylenchus destructor]|nr:rab5-interacting protein (Rab5ip) domain-containing protein [Ditylenchus destructor]